MSGLVVIMVRAKPPGSIAVIPMAEEDILQGSVTIVPGGLTGVDSDDRVLVVDTSSSISSDTSGGWLEDGN